MHDSDVYPLKLLVKGCKQLYNYFVARQIPMTMTIEPNEPNVKRVVAGLGYIIRKSLQKVATAGKAPELEVVLDKKINQRELLSLSFYSIGIMQHFIMDAVLAKIMHTHYSKKNPSKLTITKLEE